MKTPWIAGMLVGALVLGLVGGLLAAKLFPASGTGAGGVSADDLKKLADRVGAVESRLSLVEGRVARLESSPTTGGTALKIAIVDAEDLFQKVFLPQVATERAAMEAKAREIQALQADFAAGRIKQDVYQQRYARLQAELIQAQLQVNMSMLNKMIASPGFLNLKADLESLRTQAAPLEAEVANMVREAQVTILDLTGFTNRLAQLQATFQQLDQLLTQVAAVKILEVTQQVAKEKGFDFVVRTKDVVMYRREGAITDLSPDVEGRLYALFPAR